MQVGPNKHTKHGGKIPGSSSTPAKSGTASNSLNEPAQTVGFNSGYAGNSSNGANNGSIAASLQKESVNANRG